MSAALAPLAPLPQCPLQAACDFNNRTGFLLELSKTFKEEAQRRRRMLLPANNSTINTTDTSFLEALVNGSVAVDLTIYRDIQCAVGYSGPLCTVCAPGYGRVRSLECGPCPPKWKNDAYFALMYMSNVVSLLFTVRATISQNTGGKKPPLYGQARKSADQSCGPSARLLSVPLTHHPPFLPPPLFPPRADHQGRPNVRNYREHRPAPPGTISLFAAFMIIRPCRSCSSHDNTLAGTSWSRP